jgi:hypothetical protein
MTTSLFERVSEKLENHDRLQQFRDHCDEWILTYKPKGLSGAQARFLFALRYMGFSFLNCISDGSLLAPSGGRVAHAAQTTSVQAWRPERLFLLQHHMNHQGGVVLEHLVEHHAEGRSTHQAIRRVGREIMGLEEIRLERETTLSLNRQEIQSWKDARSGVESSVLRQEEADALIKLQREKEAEIRRKELEAAEVEEMQRQAELARIALHQKHLNDELEMLSIHEEAGSW